MKYEVMKKESSHSFNKCQRFIIVLFSSFVHYKSGMSKGRCYGKFQVPENDIIHSTSTICNVHHI